MTFHLENRLLARKKLGNLRRLQVHSNLIDFASNDYLGLAKSPLLKRATLQKWIFSPHLLGSTGSRLLTGNSAYVERLEKKIATFHGYEEGLLFNCGYMANLGLLSCIAGEKEAILFDAHIHASSRDGIRLSQASSFPFRHNDLYHLETRLKNTNSFKDRFICIESIYSTDGSKAPLIDICNLANQYGAHLIVDEAHAVGIYGPEGKGLVAQEGLTSQVFAQITTFGKALGCFGAIVLGSPILKEALINLATSYIYTTALPFPALAAIDCSYDLFPSLEKERLYLQKLITQVQKYHPKASNSPIQSIPIQGNSSVKQASQRLLQQGFDVRALTSPTVQKGHESLRVCLHAFNTEEELTSLCKSLFHE